MLAVAAVAVAALLMLLWLRSPAPGPLPAPLVAAAVDEGLAADGAHDAAASVRAGERSHAELAEAAPGNVEVRVVDEDGRPVAAAQVTLSRGLTMEPAQLGEVSPGGVTAADGTVVLNSVPAGLWFVLVSHPELVQGRIAQDRTDELQGRVARVEVPTMVRAEVRLAVPYAVGVRVRNGSLLSLTCETRDGGFGEPWYEHGRAALASIRAELEHRFPGTAFELWVRGLHRPDELPGTGRVVVHAQIAGRNAWRGEVTALPVREFASPIEIDAAQQTRSSAFGSVTVRAFDVAGGFVPGLTLVLHARDPSVGPQQLRNGSTTVVPSGIYEMACPSEPFVGAMLPREIAIADGVARVVDFDGRLWSRTMFDIDAPSNGRKVALAHRTAKVHCECLVPMRPWTVAMWVPEGIVDATFVAERFGEILGPKHPGAQPAEVLARAAPVLIGGGTIRAPQHVRLAPATPR